VVLRLELARTLSEGGAAVLGQAGDGAELLALCRAASPPPDVALIDIRMPVMNGVEAAKILRKEMPGVKLLVLTTCDDPAYLRDLFSVGVDGYLLKGAEGGELMRAVVGVHGGSGILDKSLIRKVGALIPPETKEARLSETEEKAARLILDGKVNKEIAQELKISYQYTRQLVSGVYRKFSAIDRQDLIGKLSRRLT